MDIEIQMQLVQAAVESAREFYNLRNSPNKDIAKVGLICVYRELCVEFERFGVPSEDYVKRIDEHVEALAHHAWMVGGGDWHQ